MTASYAYLAWDYGSVATLCVGFDVFVLCFEDFNLFPHKTLVRGQVIVVARLHVQEEEWTVIYLVTIFTRRIISSVQVLVGDARGRHRRGGIQGSRMMFASLSGDGCGYMLTFVDPHTDRES